MSKHWDPAPRQEGGRHRAESPQPRRIDSADVVCAAAGVGCCCLHDRPPHTQSLCLQVLGSRSCPVLMATHTDHGSPLTEGCALQVSEAGSFSAPPPPVPHSSLLDTASTFASSMADTMTPSFLQPRSDQASSCLQDRHGARLLLHSIKLQGGQLIAALSRLIAWSLCQPATAVVLCTTLHHNRSCRPELLPKEIVPRQHCDHFRAVTWPCWQGDLATASDVTPASAQVPQPSTYTPSSEPLGQTAAAAAQQSQGPSGSHPLPASTEYTPSSEPLGQTADRELGQPSHTSSRAANFVPSLGPGGDDRVPISQVVPEPAVYQPSSDPLGLTAANAFAAPLASQAAEEPRGSKSSVQGFDERSQAGGSPAQGLPAELRDAAQSRRKVSFGASDLADLPSRIVDSPSTAGKTAQAATFCACACAWSPGAVGRAACMVQGALLAVCAA